MRTDVRRSDRQRIAEAFRLRKLPHTFNLPPDYKRSTRYISTRHPPKQVHWGARGRPDALGSHSLLCEVRCRLQGLSTINAKAETVQEKALWRGPLQKRRCLVPADGFYEWQKIAPKTKKPFVYSLTNWQPFVLAGLWDAWKDPANGEWLQPFALITTTANEVTAPVHDRMPVILHSKDYERWLERGEAHQLPVDLLRPYEAGQMQAEPCNPAVGNVRNSGPEMLICPNPEEPPS